MRLYSSTETDPEMREMIELAKILKQSLYDRFVQRPKGKQKHNEETN